MREASKSFRLHIGLFGRRNAGKSSLLNALRRQQVSIVSEVAGTTTDPVEKPMELLPIGPVLFIDTAGHRRRRAPWANCGSRRPGRSSTAPTWALLVAEAGQWGPVRGGHPRRVPGRDRSRPSWSSTSRTWAGPAAELLDRLDASQDSLGRDGGHQRPTACSDLREALIARRPGGVPQRRRSIVADLVPPGELAVLVVPIDLEAPKGRLILPQVQAIRDLWTATPTAMVVKERELRDALDRLRRPPALVVTDSQAFLKVAGDTPPGVKMTSFSILFARQKGDLAQFVEGAMAIDGLRPGDRVLVAEACTHHPIGDDIGRVKIPRWLRQYVGGDAGDPDHAGPRFPRRPRAATGWWSTAGPACGTAARCSRGCSAAARPACRSPTTA